MRAALFLAFLLPAAALAAPVTYTLDPSHTTVTWRAEHFGFSNPPGVFSGITGTLVLDEAAPEKSTVKAEVPIAALATGLPKFNEHLLSADFFNAGKFPTATFASTKVALISKQSARVEGNVTLLGVTKPVTLTVTMNKQGTHPYTQKQTVGFSATASIKRSEFGMSTGIPGVSDAVTLAIETEASVEEKQK